MKSQPPKFSHATLLHFLNYNKHTGVFTNRITHGRAVKGARAGYINRFGYRQIGLAGTAPYAAPLAWFYVTGTWPDKEVDHKDLNKQNDSFANLRLATRAQNCANKCVPANAVGARGVFQDPRSKRYVAHIRISGRLIHLGIFATVPEASAAYKKAAVSAFGEFAHD